jgi:hypothetical protein
VCECVPGCYIFVCFADETETGIFWSSWFIYHFYAMFLRSCIAPSLLWASFLQFDLGYASAIFEPLAFRGLHFFQNDLGYASAIFEPLAFRGLHFF